MLIIQTVAHATLSQGLTTDLTQFLEDFMTFVLLPSYRSLMKVSFTEMGLLATALEGT